MVPCINTRTISSANAYLLLWRVVYWVEGLDLRVKDYRFRVQD